MISLGKIWGWITDTASQLWNAAKSLLKRFFHATLSWFGRAVEKVKEMIKGIVKGVSFLVQRIKGIFKEISKHYSQNAVDRKWTETIVQREISESEIPPEILAKANGDLQTDITKDFERDMALELNVG